MRRYFSAVIAIMLTICAMCACAPAATGPIEAVPSAQAAAEPAAPAAETPVALPDDPAVDMNGSVMDAQLVIEDGRYLTESAGALLFARTGENGMTKLFTMADGELQLSVPEFTGIDSAAYSPTGRFLAILESGADTRTLYVYDTQSQELINLGEELGSLTAAYAWDSGEDVLFCIAGQDGLRLKQVDMRSGAQQRVADLEEGDISGGQVATCLSQLYFSDEGAGYIYRYNFHTGEREQVARGVSFAVAPDGLTIASTVASAEAGASAGELVDLIITTIGGGEATALSAAQITSFCYDINSKLVIANGSATDGYAITVQSCDPASGKVTDEFMTSAQTVELSADATTVYLPVYGTRYDTYAVVR